MVWYLQSEPILVTCILASVLRKFGLEYNHCAYHWGELVWGPPVPDLVFA
jgi:hypothetical protein